MKLIEWYIFRRMLTAMVLSFLALSVMLWLSQALKEFNLVTNQGQTLATFLQLSGFLFPILVMIVLPLSVQIGVMYALTSLNSDSELAVINASGMPQWSLLKPATLIGVIATVLIATMTLYFTPLSLRVGQQMLTQVRGSLISSIAQEGAFTDLADGLVFHLQSRNPDGTLSGIFVADTRDPTKSMTYIAQRGALIDNPLGTFLVMTNGSIQQRNTTDNSISIIEFTTYAFDLSTFAGQNAVPPLTPKQQPTGYLLHPDPNDKYYQQSPGDFSAELHDRITSPLYGLVFALLPLLFVGQAQSTRVSRAPAVTLCSIVLLSIRAFAFFLAFAAPGSRLVAGLMYGLPIGAILLTVLLVLRGRQIRPPERVLVAVDGVAGWFAGLLRRRTAVATG